MRVKNTKVFGLVFLRINEALLQIWNYLHAKINIKEKVESSKYFSEDSKNGLYIVHLSKTLPSPYKLKITLFSASFQECKLKKTRIFSIAVVFLFLHLLQENLLHVCYSVFLLAIRKKHDTLKISRTKTIRRC